ncbi:MAG: hemolysin family protein [Gemmatimonadota bacterium]
MTWLIVVVGAGLAISFLCSILEAVLLSITHSYVAVLEERGSRAGVLLSGMREHIDEPIAAILTLNTIAHTVGAAVGGALALQVFGNEWIGLFSAMLTLAILILSEILPKTLGATYWQVLAPPAAYVLRVLVLVLKPVLVPLAWFNRLISPRGERQPRISRAELEVLAEIGRREGAIDEEEWRVVSNVINLDAVRVDTVMTPRTRIVAVEVGAGVETAKSVFLEEGHRRIPVYRETLDQVVGVLLARDVWKAMDEGVDDLTEVMRPPRFVPGSRSVEDLIQEMRQERLTMAIVVDEYGGTAGLVTLEDLVEEIVGEMRDEHELDPLPFVRLPDGEVRMAGAVAVREVSERLDIDLADDGYATLAGFLMGTLGRVPEEGEEIPVEGGRLRVLRMEGRRVDRIAYVPDAAESG